MSASVGGKGKTIVLNLTSMIDICAILIIFLVMGTVIGQEEVPAPIGFQFPRSTNKENPESAPEVLFYEGEVDVRFLGRKVNVEVLRDRTHPEREQLGSAIKAYVQSMPDKVKSAGALLNLNADRRTPYQDIFDLSQFFRESGFDSILFVAEGK
jgi:biopolymer transport protein ExbD